MIAILMAVFLTMTLGCEMKKIGRVDQGRVIAYDKTNKTVTMIRDNSQDPRNPDYSFLPPVTYVMPEDPNEIGPEPKAGKRMKLDAKNRQIVIFVPNLNSFATINYTLVDQKEGVKPSDALVFDSVEGKPKKYPAVDKFKKTITIYSKRQGLLTTFSVPDEYFALPDDTWDNGDEVRIYYKQEGKASRFMNISQTDIYKK